MVLAGKAYNIAEVPDRWIPTEYEYLAVSRIARLKKELCCSLIDACGLTADELDPKRLVPSRSGLFVPQSLIGGIFNGLMTGEMIVKCFRSRSQVPNAGWGGHDGLNDVDVNPEHAEELASVFNRFAEKYGYSGKITAYACACFIAIPSTENGTIEPGNLGGPFAVIRAQTRYGSNWDSFDKFCQSDPEFSDCGSKGLQAGSPDRRSCYVAGAWYFFVHTRQIEFAIQGDAEQIARHHLGAGYPDAYFQKGVMFDSNQYFYGYIHGVAKGEFGFGKNHPNYVGQVNTFSEIISGMSSPQIYFDGPSAAPEALQPVDPESSVRGSKEWACGGKYDWKTGSPPESLILPRIASVDIQTRNESDHIVNRRIMVHRGLVPKFRAIFQEILQNTDFKITSVGGYNYRVVKGLTTLSNHSFGTAVDINPGVNPYLKTGRVNLRSDAARAGDSDTRVRSVFHPVVRIFAKYGFVWGARYNVGPDYMHFEWAGPGA